jgi:hypothetical protein
VRSPYAATRRSEPPTAEAPGETTPATSAPTAPYAIATALAPPLADVATRSARPTVASAPGTVPRTAVIGHAAKKIAAEAAVMRGGDERMPAS